MKRCLIVSVYALVAAGFFQAFADVRMPAVFGSNMVLQQGMPVKLWGWAEPGESVAVSLGDAKGETKAAGAGEWRLELSARKASTVPVRLVVKGKNEIVFENVLVGEVWLCSGQSNMEMGIGMVKDEKKEVAGSSHPEIRLFKVPKRISASPLANVDATWKVCDPESILEGGWHGFSAAAYFFGRELNKELGVPVGLIDASWGGTMIEPWIAPEGFAKVPALEAGVKPRIDALKKLAEGLNPSSESYREKAATFIASTEAWLGQAKKARESGLSLPPAPVAPQAILPPGNPQEPTVLFNGMLAPVIPFAVRGSVWYQGESNRGDGMAYVEKTKALVEGWRQLWNAPDMPYYLVQIAPFMYANENPVVVPAFWRAQFEIPKVVRNAGIVGTVDIGEVGDIHPKNKQEVGRRLALQALRKTYGKTDLVADGPSFKALTVKGSVAVVAFDNVGSGLASRDGKPLSWFEISADGATFVKAEAKIEGGAVVVSAASVERPVAVRFAWDKVAEPNLMNAEGLPAYPFSTD